MQILIVDLGSQYTLLIGRALRELGVRSIILPPEKVASWLDRDTPKGIILSGGAVSIYDSDAPVLPDAILEKRVPVLGICLGMHWLAMVFGGEVRPDPSARGYGGEDIKFMGRDPLLAYAWPWCKEEPVWMSHGDSVTKLPPRFQVIASSASCPIAAMASAEHRIWGVQFHPEVVETTCGREILHGFLDLCGATQDWEPADVIEEIREGVRSAVKPDEKCILAFSGGVDSSTLTAIVAPILSNRLTCVTLYHGGLRQNEEHEIAENAIATRCWVGDPAPPDRPAFHLLYCPRTFLEVVAGAGIDAEDKRRAFRAEYRRRLEAFAAEHGASVLIQGTLAPDIIESGEVGEASHIVTHHNVGIGHLHPLADLFKYEVRDLARHLKLPLSITERKPFPGPGLYCRIVGVPVTQELLKVVRWADAEVRGIIAEAGLEPEFDQLVVALLGVLVAGIKGDGRGYAYLAAVRAVRTSDFMTCRGYQFPPRPDNPAPIRKRIEKALVRHPQIVGVVFDETDKPPRRTEFE